MDRTLAALLRFSIRTFGAVSLAWALAGCTPDAARRDADIQVHKILNDRTLTTLGYDPQTTLSSKAPDSPDPPRRAYQTIPVTPLIPPGPSPIEPSITAVPYGPLGPLMLFPRNMGAVDPTGGVSLDTPGDPLGVEASSRGIRARLVQGPPAPGVKPPVLDLFKSLEYGVNHSRSYQDQMDNLYAFALDVTTQRHVFDAIPFVDTTVGYTGDQAPPTNSTLNNPNRVGYQSALRVVQRAGVSKRFGSGATVTATALAQFVDALNETTQGGEEASLALRGTLPILRGAGFVNLENLVSSEREVVYQVRAFDNFRRDYVVQVATAYFQLLSAQQAVANRQGSVRSLAVLTERTQALYDAGRISFLEVQRSLQSYLSGQNQLVVTQASLQRALDNFKIILGMPVEQEIEIVGVRLDVEVPDIDSPDVLDVAIKHRLDLQTSRDRIDDARRRVKNAENGLLPDLDLTGGTSIGNRAGDDARQLDARALSYDAAVTLSLPIDRLNERNDYRAALLNYAKSQRDYVTARDTAVGDVRNAVRLIRAAQTTLDIQRNAIDLATRRLDFSNELLKQGKTDARNVVEAQDSLLIAQDAFETARASLQTQVLQFLRTTGTLRVDPTSGSIGRAMTRGEK